MSPPAGKSKGGGGGAVPVAMKTVAVCIVAYLAGVVLSPRIVPVDFLSSKLQRLKPPQPHGGVEGGGGGGSSSPTPASPPTKLPRMKKEKKKIKADDNGAEAAQESPQRQRREASPHDTSYRSLVGIDAGVGAYDPFLGVDLVVHRNGEPDPCSRQADDDDDDDDGGGGGDLSAASRALLLAVDARHNELNKKPLEHYGKYDFDAVLTHALAVGGDDQRSLLRERGRTCGPTWKEGTHYMDNAPHLKGKPPLSPMIKFCDMGTDKTPVQLDHKDLIQARTPQALSLPCHFHTREGVRIVSLGQLAHLARMARVPPGECAEDERAADGTCAGDADASGAGGRRRELHLYAVPAGRVFMFAPKFVGETFELPHVKVPRDLPVWLEVISLSPRVFDVFNFFDREESAAIVDKALKETSDTHRIKRSSTGASGYNVNSQRTSENGFDTHGKEAQAVKRRCMNVLGFDTYEESLTDGLQVLRYNMTTAYVPHLDWIDDYGKQQEHDFDSEHLGSNRYATILLYMTDIEEGNGGETVFTHGWPPGQAEDDHVQFSDALAALRESGDVEALLERNSWEEKMVARCRSRLAIRPHSSRAVLFYSQNPDGTPDDASMHGGCPVIQGEKWAANLWVWNAPRGGFPGSPVNQQVVDRNRSAGKSPENDLQKKAMFANTKTDDKMKDAKLYFQDTFWGDLGFGDPALNVNTYEGHQWNVKVGEKTLKTFVITKDPMQQYNI